MNAGWERRARAGALMGVLLLVGMAARADVHALLVGVSGYREPYARLEGPRFDAPRLRDVLAARGIAPDRIEVLADGVPGGAEPTRSAILGRLSRLAERARAGDTVVLYFAGHGSRVPGPRAEDPLIEVFLPLDAGPWDPAQRRLRNAITSAELREAVDRIGSRGAFVWAIFDACHSARLVRGEEPSAMRWRTAPPQQLGVPQADLDRAARVGAAPPPAAAGPTAFFYAAQAHETTNELKLPSGTVGARPHGLFSYVLAQALERAGPVSYRQLAQQVLAVYQNSADAHATPLFSGNALDSPVLGGVGTPVRQWPLQTDGGQAVLPAGALSGLAQGAVLALLPGPLAGDGQRRGHLRISTLEAERSWLEPLAFADLPAPSEATVRAGGFLRLVHNPPSLALGIAVQPCVGGCALAQAAARLRRDGVPGTAARWVDSPEAADVVLVQQRDRVLLTVPGPGRGREAELAALPAADPELAARLAVRLHAVARSRNLLRVAGRLASEGPHSGVVVTLERRSAAGAPLQAMAGQAVAPLRAGEELEVTVHNPGPGPVDLTVLYLDADHGVVTLYPSAAGETNRIEAGTRRVIDRIHIHAPPAGLERLVLITAPSRRQGETRDYSFLQQPALQRLRAGGGAQDDLFSDAAFASHVGRGTPAPPAPGVAAQLFTFDVRP
jgi:Caspase domain